MSRFSFRPQVEQLDGRCVPSANPAITIGDVAHTPPAASVRASHEHAVPIKATTHCFTDINSLTVSTTGFGTGGLGHYTSLGHIDDHVIGADQAVYSGTGTLVAANGDQVFFDFTTSWQLSTGEGTHSITVTGGTGRFAGASGDGTLECIITLDLASQTATCAGQGSGMLILAHP